MTRPESLAEFLHPAGLRIVDVVDDVRIPETPHTCVLCGQRIKADRPIAQALYSHNEGIAVVCDLCVVEVPR